MDNDWLTQQLLRFDPDASPATAPPSSWYTESAFYEIDRDAVFARHWLAGARADQLQRPGSFVAASVANTPYLVVRGNDGVLRAFLNVCRHEAAQVLIGEGCEQELMCPLHGWTYRLDGRLLRAPEFGDRDFDVEAFALEKIHVTADEPIVFVCSSKTTPTGAAPETSIDRDRVYVGRREHELKGNWKLLVEHLLHHSDTLLEYPNLVVRSEGPLSAAVFIRPREVRFSRVLVEYFDGSPGDGDAIDALDEAIRSDIRTAEKRHEQLAQGPHDGTPYAAGGPETVPAFHRRLAVDYATPRGD